MTDSESAPPPPPPSNTPPPPTGPPPSSPPPGQPQQFSPEGGDIRKDNPIALASLIVAVAGLLLSIVIIGGVVGLIAIVMASVGLKRSKLTNSGRGFAIGGIMLGLLSVVASAGAVALLVSALQSGDFSLDGLANSADDNAEFPPEEDILEIECTDDGLALATLTIENPTESRQSYTIIVTWDSTSGEVLSESLDSEIIQPGEEAELRIFQRSSAAIAESCSVSSVERIPSLFG